MKRAGRASAGGVGAGRKMPGAVVADLLALIRNRFYLELPEKRWHWERSLLLQVITWPARVLHAKGALLPWDEYAGILKKIIGTVTVHGDTGAIRSPGRYLLKAVQEHMRIHWEEYYTRAKQLRGTVAAVVAGVQVATEDRTVEELAAMHRVVAAGGGRRKKQAGLEGQGSLF